ncbi:MAG: T9SS C-terminal target domain-containing protein [Calditrichaeota bacterium]|nr:MAG: T9SS C-terminal target domain-containing protein [Calditrichota bacterium]
MLSKILTVLLLLFSTAFAAEYYIDGRIGSDLNSGDKEHPFATIQKAAQTAVAGDVCMIRQGYYRESVRPLHSGQAGAPIRFEAFENETVYIAGTTLLQSGEWQPYSGAVFVAQLPAGTQVSQVFVLGEQMEIARFPNNLSDNLLFPTLGTAQSATAKARPALSDITDPLLNSAPTNLQGADLWLLSGLKWISFTMPIESHQGSTIQFLFSGDIEPAYQPEAGSSYFITGSLGLLDAEGEWFYDAAGRSLYFYPPATSLALEVEVRTRQWGLDLSGRSDIEFRNINFFAASINFDNAQRCLVENSRVLYPTPFFPTDGWAHTENPQNSPGAGIKLGGRENVLQNCEVAFSWGDGVTVFGDGNTVDNCLIHDFAWICSDAAGVHTSGMNHVITQNSIYNGARSGLVHRKTKGLEIAYNDIYDCGLMCTDLGATYCYQTDGGGTVIHHNWVHDVVTAAHTAGIYLDNGSSNFIVHHNVVWNTDDLGIQTNLDARNHQIYHNTIWNCAEAMGGGGGDIHEKCKVYNNLSNANKWFGTDVQQNLVLGDAHFVDELNHNFRLRADSPARDDYVIAAVFLNGGFESGVGGWNGAGSLLESITDPVHSGNRACRSYNRRQYWEGVRQDVTEVLKDHGPGSYTIEAWIYPASGAVDGYLRFKLVDESGERYPGTTRRCSAGQWTKVTYKTSITWKGALKEAVFELMTSNDTALPDLYLDDCSLITPAAVDTTRPRGSVPVAGINDNVADGKPDAGAYEYGDDKLDWEAGSTLKPLYTGVKILLSSPARPNSFTLQQNFPNPCNGSTTIRFTLESSAKVNLEIYNILGNKVTGLIARRVPGGEHSILWDGADDDGLLVSSGIYIYRLQVEQGEKIFRESKKLVYVR